ncbi:8-oxoguanine glycosylase ogg1 [Tulasnella sp. 417]|nr:8-oxoguanine glycosylase ogg1 [Tulasnella sp. 417]
MSTVAIPGFRSLPLSITQLNLSAVLKCGQSFRWRSYPLDTSNPTPDPAPEAPPCEWRLTLDDRVVCLRQTSSNLYYRSLYPPSPVAATEEKDAVALTWLRDYFQLDIDLENLYEEWSKKDPIFKGVKDRFSGIRMLRQDPWENVISFICSQNNHISRISSMVQNLCIHFSPALLAVPGDGKSQEQTFHPFPPPAALADPSVETRLRELGFGYRAKYIQKTAALLCERHKDPQNWLKGLRTKSIDEAREALLELHGVGPKVADCILLMSLDKASIVPVDTHVYQIAVKHYGLRAPLKANMTPVLYAQVAQKLTGVWGDYAGWAHSVMFTADLRSFADFGLPSPSPSTTPVSSTEDSSSATPTKKRKAASGKTSNSARSPSKRSRQLYVEESSTTLDVTAAVTDDAESSTLVERIKLRRRTRSST